MQSVCAIAGRFLSLMAIAGLVILPITKPATWFSNASAEVIGDAMLAMPEDMPCCPKQAPVSDCGKDCPFAAICGTPFFCNPAQQPALVMPVEVAGLLVPRNDARLAGLSQGPPPRPPDA
jgi:hypothetical protein